MSPSARAQTSTSVLDGHHSSNSSHRRERPRRPAWRGLASLLTSQAPRSQFQPQLTFPTTPLRTRRARLPTPLEPLNLSSELFLPVRPPSLGEEGGRGRGHGWEVGRRARRPSVVVSWLRGAVAEWLQL